jgi:hypothetical protein
MALYSCHSKSKVTPLRLSSWWTMAQSGVGRRVMGVWAAVANSRPSRAVSSREDVSEVLVCYSLGVYETQSNPQATRVIA